MPGAPIIETTADGQHKALSLGLIRQGQFAYLGLTKGHRYREGIQLTRSELNRFGDACKDFAAAMPVRREV